MSKFVAIFLLISVLLGLSAGQITIEMKETKIHASHKNPLEIFLTTDVDFGEGQSKSVQTIIDNSVTDSYIFEKAQCGDKCWTSSVKSPLFSCEQDCSKDPKDTKSYPIKVLNDMAELSVKKAEVKIDIENTQEEETVLPNVPVKFVESLKPLNSMKQDVVKSLFQEGARAGLGFGQGKNNFLNNFQKHKSIEYKGFSFWLDGEYKRMYLGKKQGFLEKYSPALTMARLEGTDDWKVKMEQAKYGDNLLQPGKQTVEAIISTTTAFVHMPSKQFNSFINYINTEANNVCETKDNKESYLCKCNSKELKDLKVSFTEYVDEEDPNFKKAHEKNRELKIKVEDFLTYVEDKVDNKDPKKKCLLMVKKGYLPEGKNDAETWVLGTPFLKSNYVYFNAQNNQIEASNLYEFNRENMTINSIANVWFWILGITIAMIGICVLLSVFTKVQYVPQEKPTNVIHSMYHPSIPVSFSPQRQVIRTFVQQQPVQIMQSMPPQYQQTFPYQAPTTVIQQSPSRISQQQLQQQQGNFNYQQQ